MTDHRLTAEQVDLYRDVAREIDRTASAAELPVEGRIGAALSGVTALADREAGPGAGVILMLDFLRQAIADRPETAFGIGDALEGLLAAIGGAILQVEESKNQTRH
ncbi:hypothetical protein J2848_000363 [Azospirillum lipoferum]|uniref:Uncharacterized protein n=1 Tax=Azospirillum lipoferum TaxID=193 RepID=A0A5A9GTQ4_AZOLI|nr:MULTISPECIES: hypothetical protein [Azospirillum]KAA0597215.1 hypothetical protein FZ942_08985 [Azospirillum lipoferum]MCP1608727.1 hypothetical protein [Azospirillum lipoferum]MDW5535955.1 hypothetical protein [Azospirillum sp. NL1]